jgi:hypothetical protein
MNLDKRVLLYSLCPFLNFPELNSLQRVNRSYAKLDMALWFLAKRVCNEYCACLSFLDLNIWDLPDSTKQTENPWTFHLIEYLRPSCPSPRILLSRSSSFPNLQNEMNNCNNELSETRSTELSFKFASLPFNCFCRFITNFFRMYSGNDEFCIYRVIRTMLYCGRRGINFE